MIGNRQDFDNFFTKTYSEFLRYTATIMLSRKISATRIHPKEIVNDVYIDLYNKEKHYINKKEKDAKGMVLQAIKWKLWKNLTYFQKNSYVLLEPNEESGVMSEELLLSDLNLEKDLMYRIDAEPIINYIKSHKDKAGAEYFLEHLSTNPTISQIAQLNKKHNITKNRQYNIMAKFHYFISKDRLSKIKENNKTDLNKIMKISAKINNPQLTERQKIIRDRVFETVILLNKGVSISEIAKKFNVERSTVYHYIKLSKTKWIPKNYQYLN